MRVNELFKRSRVVEQQRKTAVQTMEQQNVESVSTDCDFDQIKKIPHWPAAK